MDPDAGIADWPRLIARSYRQHLGNDLAPSGDLYDSPRVVLCHRLSEDQRLTYVNLAAQRLWERPWQTFVGLPSRLTAPPEARVARAAALSADGVSTGYSGERISATGRRFLINDATIWPVADDTGRVIGQAATFAHWTHLDRPLLEVLATDLSQVRAAVQSGADRIELCTDYDVGGLTPAVSLMRDAVAEAAQAGVGVMVMIRPRAGDFVYSQRELDQMRRSIDDALAAGAAGLVLGCLTATGQVAKVATSALLRSAPGVPVTFHRAVDVSADPVQAAMVAFELGCARVLTSGGRPTAEQGAATIAAMVADAPADAIVMAGSGVRSHNAAAVRAATGVTEVHASLAYFDHG